MANADGIEVKLLLNDSVNCITPDFEKIRISNGEGSSNQTYNFEKRGNYTITGSADYADEFNLSTGEISNSVKVLKLTADPQNNTVLSLTTIEISIYGISGNLYQDECQVVLKDNRGYIILNDSAKFGIVSKGIYYNSIETNLLTASCEGKTDSMSVNVYPLKIKLELSTTVKYK